MQIDHLRPLARVEWIAIVLLVCPSTFTAAQAVPPDPRPEIRVADSACSCPSVAGTFVALFEPERGVLLLSGAPFPGGRAVGEASGDAFTVPGARPWALDQATARVAVQIGYTDRPYWERAEKPTIGVVVGSSDVPAELTDPPLAIVIEGVNR